MVDAIFTPNFKKCFEKIKDKSMKDKIIKQLIKIRQNPQIGKPMMYSRKGTRELYIKPYRLSYLLDKNIIVFIDLYHKDEQ